MTAPVKPVKTLNADRIIRLPPFVCQAVVVHKSLPTKMQFGASRIRERLNAEVLKAGQ